MGSGRQPRDGCAILARCLLCLLLSLTFVARSFLSTNSCNEQSVAATLVEFATDEAVLPLAWTGRVFPALDLVAVLDELKLGTGKGVADPQDKLEGRVPPAVAQHLFEGRNARLAVAAVGAVGVVLFVGIH